MISLVGPGDGPSEVIRPQTSQPRRLPLSWGVKIKKKLKAVAPFLGKFRPVVGQCCHRCTPDSLGWKLLQTSPSLGFQNLLFVNEMHTRYRGWLVRRLCCVLFIRGCRVYPSTVSDRSGRICNSSGVRQTLYPEGGVSEENDMQPLILNRGKTLHILPLLNTCISPFLLRLASWILLKVLNVMFCSVQVNLNQLAALHRASQLRIEQNVQPTVLCQWHCVTTEGAPLVFVSQQNCHLDYALIPLVLFCHNIRVPYTLCHLQLGSSWLRSVLQRLGVLFLPPPSIPEQSSLVNRLYSAVMTSLATELLREGQSLSFTLDGESGDGAQWLAQVRMAVRNGLVPDVNLVPVGISYDCPLPPTGNGQMSLLSVLQFGVSLLRGGQRGSVRVHFAQAFSLKEMCETGRCQMDGGCSLQKLLLPAMLYDRSDTIFGQKSMSRFLPLSCCPELHPSERQLTIALTLHLLYSTTTCTAIMSTSLVSCLLLHKHRKGVRLSQLCRDVCWLLEEVLFRSWDVGFGGSLSVVVYHALSLLRPNLLLASLSPASDTLVAPHPSPAAFLALSRHCQLLTNVFILEAVGACAVSAMLHQVACCAGDMEVDVALCEDQLTMRAVQLCHLLPAGCFPPCQSSHSFSLDAVDSLVRCGILVMEETSQDHPVCDFWRRREMLMWSSADDPDLSDSDCEEKEPRCYKLSQPSQCPELLFFLCSLLSVQLRALSWAIEGLQGLHNPLPESCCVAQLHAFVCNRAKQNRMHYESTSSDLVRAAVQTLIDLGVLDEEMEKGGVVFLGLSPPFQQSENREKVQRFVAQFLCD